VSKSLPVLYVDDEPDNLTLFRLTFGSDFDVRTAGSGAEALELLARHDIAVLLSDERMPNMRGVDLLASVAERWPDVVRVIVSAYGDAARLLAAINRGHAHEYIVKPWNEGELRSCLERALTMAERRRELSARAERAEVLEADERARLPDMVGLDGGLASLGGLARRAAATDSTVLILGETGTGKELVARFIHEHSARAAGPFVAVSCAALAEGVLESELYGHEQGAFTGAARMRRGRFELARGGTLFLDEVGELPARVQVSLLRVLQERTVERVGSSVSVPIDARVVVATHRDLEERVREGQFRADLYFRLNVIPLRVPPLRERVQDIAPLVEHFILRWARRGLGPRPTLAPDVLAALEQYGWPGNVRELENLVQRALALAPNGTLTLEDFAFQLAPAIPAATPGAVPIATAIATPIATTVRQEARDAEAQRLRELLLFHGGNCTRAAAAAGIPRTTLISRLKKHALI
jgi:DNA-binding NtrC family response regulator